MSDPIHVQHTQVNGHKIAYRELGEGDPVVLIHGIPTSSLMWRDVMPTLAAKRRVIALDMLNYGQSGKPAKANVSIEAQSRIVVGLMQALGLGAADIVSHDIGGGVAQIMAVNHPERVRKLVLIDSVCFDSWPIPEFKPLQEEGAEDKMSLDEFLEMMRQFMPQGVHDKSALDQSTIDMILAPWSSEEGKRALFRNFRRLNPEHTQAIAGELEHLRHPTLVMWATEDVFQKPHYAERLAETIPNAKLVWIEQAGHWLLEEKPEAVGRELIGFLDG